MLWRALTERPSRATRRRVAGAAMHRILVTGAAGMVASAIRPGLRRTFREVLLTDVQPVRGLARNERYLPGDIRDVDRLRVLLENVDGVVHLAGLAKESSREALDDVNVRPFNTLLSAAAEAGVRRIVLASTMHVLGLYRRDEPISPYSAPRPDSRYAESKLAMEAAAVAASDARCSTAILRIGCLKSRREDSEPGGWIGERDLMELIALLLVHPRAAELPWPAVAVHEGDDVGQGVMASRLGLRFRAAGLSYHVALEQVQRWYPNDDEARIYRGGEFASRTIRSTGSGAIDR